MTRRTDRYVLLVLVVVVAPIAAAVILTALLLFGVPPPLVFAPGHALKAILGAVGVAAPNAVGVLTTGAVWWLAVVLAILSWDQLKTRRGA